jgi:acetyltransferase-like isoleucine patch superfamily enzyme
VDTARYGYVADTATIAPPIHAVNLANVFIYDKAVIQSGATLLVTDAKFIMKHHACAGNGFTVVDHNHISKVEHFTRDLMRKADKTADVVVEEDVWIGNNVTLLQGVTVGRGASIGAGCVVRDDIPPYAIVVGNPAKVVGFKFNPMQVIKHEKALYPEEERLPMETLMDNYEKYYVDRMEEILAYLKF